MAFGRPSIFRPKDPTARVQGQLTAFGARCFEAARKRLAALTGWKPEAISDGDTIDYLARGEVQARQELKRK